MEEKLTTRRKVLIGMTAAVGSAGIPFAAVPFLSAWNPSAKAKAVGAPVKVDISKIQQKLPNNVKIINKLDFLTYNQVFISKYSTMAYDFILVIGDNHYYKLLLLKFSLTNTLFVISFKLAS